MKHGIYRDVLLVPEKQPSLARTYEAFGNPKALPNFCRHRRDGRFALRSPASDSINKDSLEVLTSAGGERYVFGGHVCHHFGHFISEYVHRLWVISEAGLEDATVIFLDTMGDDYLAPFFEQLMQYFGVKKWRVLTKAVVVEELVVAEAGQFLGERVKGWYLPLLAKQAETNQLFHADGPKKVALTRGHLNKGSILGEAGFERFLERSGYIIYRPEDHDIADQLQTIANAEKLVVTEGSACHLFDVLPALNCEVAFIARRPNPQIDKFSVEPKVKKIYRFGKAMMLMEPLRYGGKCIDAAGVSYIDYQQLAGFLYKHDFIDCAALDIGAIPFRADLEQYVAEHFCEPVSQNNSVDVALHCLLREVMGKSARASSAGILASLKRLF